MASQPGGRSSPGRPVIGYTKRKRAASAEVVEEDDLPVRCREGNRWKLGAAEVAGCTIVDRAREAGRQARQVGRSHRRRVPGEMLPRRPKDRIPH